MKKKNLFTTQKESIPEEQVYLTFIAEELSNHKRKKILGSYVSVPTGLAIEYLEYMQKYYDELSTCLKKFHGKKSNFFTLENKKIIAQKYDDEARIHIDELLDEVSEKLEKTEKKSTIKITDNSKADENLKKWFSSDEEKDFKILSDSFLEMIARKLKIIAQKGLMVKAFDHAKDRIIFEDPFRAKKLKHSIDEIYQDLIINNRTGKPKQKYLNKSLADIVNDVVKNYEILHKTDYSIDISTYKYAIRGNFEPKLKKFRNKS